MTTLTFNNTTLTIINQDNQIWLTSSELAKSLGYKQSRAVTKIYNSNSDEFTNSMTQVIEVPNSGTSSENKGLKVKTRIFSLRGCHLIAMFSRTKVAKDFRVWVLNVLDHKVGSKNKTLTISTTQDRAPLKDAVNTYCAKSGAIYSDIWKMIHQRFGVTKVDQLTVEQIPHAVEYVHSMILASTSVNTDIAPYEYLATAKKEALEYVWELQRTIQSLGGELPKFPNINQEQLCQAFITRLFMSNRVMLNFGDTGSPSMSFVPTEHYVVSPKNIDAVVDSVDKKLLPSIIETAVNRLAR